MVNYLCAESISTMQNQLAVSIQEIGKEIGLGSDSIRLYRNRIGNGSDSIPIDSAIQFVQQRINPEGRRTQEQADAARVVLARLESMKQPVQNEPKEIAQPAEEFVQDQEAPQKPAQKTWMLFIPLVLATVASVANMYLICLHMADGDRFSAWVMTGVFSGSALCFILSGAVGSLSKMAMWLLIAFESGCNVTGVYHGLLGRTGVPTRFLGMVTDILETGTHYTAVGLGVVMALIISIVQIASIKSIISHGIYTEGRKKAHREAPQCGVDRDERRGEKGRSSMGNEGQGGAAYDARSEATQTGTRFTVTEYRPGN